MWSKYSIFCGLFVISLSILVESYGIKPTLCSGRTKDLRKMTYVELRGFFESFDTVVTDIDGVLMKGTSFIPGTIEVLKKLENRRKSIVFVTNNSFFTVQEYIKLLGSKKYRATTESIITPATTVVSYLQSIDFEGKALVIGNKKFINVLVENGIQVITGPDSVDETDPKVSNDLIKNIDNDVKAVIVEADANVNMAKIVQASSYLLNKKDMLFLVGASDKRVLIGSRDVVGPGYFAEILIDFVNRQPISYAKPGNIVRDFINENFGGAYSRRTLFIGDSLDIDMKFGVASNYTTLWIGTGVDKNADRENCKIAPDYYLSDLSQMPFVHCTE